MEQSLNATLLDAGLAPRALSGPAAEPIELSSSSNTAPIRLALSILVVVLAVLFGLRRLRK